MWLLLDFCLLQVQGHLPAAAPDLLQQSIRQLPDHLLHLRCILAGWREAHTRHAAHTGQHSTHRQRNLVIQLICVAASGAGGGRARRGGVVDAAAVCCGQLATQLMQGLVLLLDNSDLCLQLLGLCTQLKGLRDSSRTQEDAQRQGQQHETGNEQAKPGASLLQTHHVPNKSPPSTCCKHTVCNARSKQTEVSRKQTDLRLQLLCLASDGLLLCLQLAILLLDDHLQLSVALLQLAVGCFQCIQLAQPAAELIHSLL